ncbi:MULTISPECIES: acyl-CoA thioesterase II [Mycobacteriaceae]|uniref:acyl-CoA thioesterase n=1 Tax=Mycobacteriaceae TaxID=1762 RepID=UPI0007FE5725|nr:MULTISPECIES: acyl-CoA thioesterase domain-containing protein [Mycobacteriaceae]MCK0173285.1 thioesterase family protein [Mycolicibacterium sp. F2034L]OBB62285.1 acyl-CoA thioesterase II [Mycobacterium sp. 852013-51886_SCH5428379]
MTSAHLPEIVSTLDVDQVGDDQFVATQIDNPAHHIVGGHIAGQALMSAGRTVGPDRIAHSVHVYLLRAGDARRPVDFAVTRLRDGGVLSSRRVLATQDGQVLLEALASFTVPLESLDYHQPLPDVPAPESLPTVQEQLSGYAAEHGGHWVRPQPIELRYVDPPPRLSVDLPEREPRIRKWWRPVGSVPGDALMNSCLLTYVAGTTLLETAMVARRTTPVDSFSALVDHALWFHRPADLGDWVLSDAVSPSGIGGRGLATATMYNRSGGLVCTATQEIYFGRSGPR